MNPRFDHEPDHEFEAELAAALARKRPRAGLADRVAARIAADEQRRHASRWNRIAFQRAAAALTLVAALGAWGGWRHVERVRGERARREVLLALQIASEKVRVAQTEVRRVGE